MQKHTDLSAHKLAHCPYVWHQPRLANKTCAWSWTLCEINLAKPPKLHLLEPLNDSAVITGSSAVRLKQKKKTVRQKFNLQCRPRCTVRTPIFHKLSVSVHCTDPYFPQVVCIGALHGLLFSTSCLYRCTAWTPIFHKLSVSVHCTDPYFPQVVCIGALHGLLFFTSFLYRCTARTPIFHKVD